MIGLRSKHITWTDHRIPAGYSTPDSANYMRLLPGGNIEVRTLYRFGKPAIKEYTPEEFDNWQKECDRLAI